MSNKLVERFVEIGNELEEIRQISQIADGGAIQQRMDELEIKQTDLKKTLMQLIALSKMRDEAWLALSHGTTS